MVQEAVEWERFTEAVGRPRRHGSTLRRAAGAARECARARIHSRRRLREPAARALARCARSSHRDVWHHRARRRSTRRPTAQPNGVFRPVEGDSATSRYAHRRQSRFIGRRSTSVPATRAPELGEHRPRTAAGAGYSAPRIDALVRDGVLRTPETYKIDLTRRRRGMNRPVAAARWIFIALLLTGVAIAQGPPADLILVNGNLFTGDPTLPSATAVAIRGERIIAVGACDGHRCTGRHRDTPDRSAWTTRHAGFQRRAHALPAVPEGCAAAVRGPRTQLGGNQDGDRRRDCTGPAGDVGVRRRRLDRRDQRSRHALRTRSPGAEESGVAVCVLRPRPDFQYAGDGIAGHRRAGAGPCRRHLRARDGFHRGQRSGVGIRAVAAESNPHRSDLRCRCDRRVARDGQRSRGLRHHDGAGVSRHVDRPLRPVARRRERYRFACARLRCR